MTERKRRKKNKQRGERTHGKGDTKNNRGGGSRGGRGNAGSTKGKFASIGRLKERKYRLKPKEKGKVISLGELDQKIEKMVENGKAVKEKEYYVIDKKSGYGKVLGQGNTNKKIFLQIPTTKTGEEKIIKAGGKTKKEDEEFS